jgi:putative PIN family toxin of toxin-antitoxin system
LKIVLDTNVVVSAFLKPQSIPAKILRLVLQEEIHLVANEAIFAEYQEVLERPGFALDQSRVQVILDYLRRICIFADALPETPELSDPGDIPFLEAAIAGHADVLVTGNVKHFPKSKCKGKEVLSPAEFLQYLNKAIL